MTEPAETVRILRVFVSSPRDVAEERKLLEEVIDRINETDGIDRSIRFELWKWERHAAPRIGPPPQKTVDDQTPPYDIYLGIMSARFGTPTEEHGSGTEKEFRDAVKSWGSQGTPWILFYFRDDPPLSRKAEDVEQYLRVVTFREALEKLGIVGSYSTPRGAAGGFFERVEQHLRKVARTFVPLEPRTPAGPQPVRARTPQVPTAYRQWLLAHCAEVELLGLKPKEGRAIRLHSVYVPVTTPAGESADPKESAEARLRTDRRKPQLLLDLLDRESLYVPGAPGSGKSTFCRWVAHLASAGSMPDQPIEPPEGYEENFPASLANRLPLLVRLREFWSYLPHAPGCREITRAQLERSLESWLQSVKPGGLEWADVEAHLGNGSALLLFDGVDEIPLSLDETRPAWCPRAMLLSGLADALKTWVPRGNRVLLTSRPYGVEGPARTSWLCDQEPSMSSKTPFGNFSSASGSTS